LRRNEGYSPRMKRSIAARVGERIRGLRLHAAGRKLTQERLAERAEISVSFLSMIERGERSAHVETLAQLAGALNVPLAELFRDETRAKRGTDATLKPLADFVRRQRLNRTDVERLLTVAQALFDRRA
jgi:transcriptional regulator with XRE-family HTH domain